MSLKSGLLHSLFISSCALPLIVQAQGTAQPLESDVETFPAEQVLDENSQNVSGLPLDAAELDNDARLPLEDLRSFADVFNQIRMSYVEDIEDREILEHAIRGMLSGLDPHSAYLDADSFDDLQSHTTGEFGGLGLEVAPAASTSCRRTRPCY